MKKLSYLTIFLLLTLVVACGNDETTIKHPSEASDGDKVKITGQIISDTGTASYTIKDGLHAPDDHYTIFEKGDESIDVGEYVQVKGVWIAKLDAVETNDFKVLSEDEKQTYFQERFAYLNIAITDYPEEVSHGCATPKFELEFHNKGEETITHEKLHDDEYPYTLYYFIDDEPHRAFRMLDDYDNTFAIPTSPNLDTVHNLALHHFDDLKPNDKTEIAYWGGGHVTDESTAGIAGIPNIIQTNGEQGENEISFAWAIKNNFDPIFLFQTDPVTVDLITEECIMR